MLYFVCRSVDLWEPTLQGLIESESTDKNENVVKKVYDNDLMHAIKSLSLI